MDSWWVSPGLVFCDWWWVFYGGPILVSSPINDGVGSTPRMSLTGAWFWKPRVRTPFGGTQISHAPCQFSEVGKAIPGLWAPLLSWLSVGCHLALAGRKIFSQATMALQGAKAFLPSSLSRRIGGTTTLMSISGYDWKLSTWNGLTGWESWRDSRSRNVVT